MAETETKAPAKATAAPTKTAAPAKTAAPTKAAPAKPAKAAEKPAKPAKEEKVAPEFKGMSKAKMKIAKAAAESQVDTATQGNVFPHPEVPAEVVAYTPPKDAK